MKITKIHLYNFGPFQNEHTVDFNADSDGVHIIRGQNGQGKTSILRAIMWALYGEIKDRKGKSVRTTSLINRNAVSDGVFHFFVQLYITIDGKEGIISRSMSATAHQDARYQRGMEITFEKDNTKIENPQNEIELLLPESTSRFFFFDGEMLRDYEELLDQKSTAMKLLKNSIETILGIPYLTTTMVDVNSVLPKENERD